MIAVTINCHENSSAFKQTIQSVKNNLSEKILLVLDGNSEKNTLDDIKDVYKLHGLVHGFYKSPYKNIILGLYKAWEIWNDDVDWYCYLEPDCLIGKNNRILEDLNKTDAWLYGNNLRKGKLSIAKTFSQKTFPFLENIIKNKLDDNFYYLIGCYMFFKKDFIKKLVDLNFFNEFIKYTSAFSKDTFPYYSGYDISECLYPTLCHNLGGKIKEFANFNDKKMPQGNLKYYCRWQPELNDNDFDVCKNAYIMHPIKSDENKILKYHTNS